MEIKLSRLVEGFEELGLWRERGLNAEIARRTGFTPSYVGKVFKGLSVPADKFLIAVCEAFEIRREWVFEGKKPVLQQVSVTASSLMGLDEAEAFLYERFGDDILPAFRKAVYAMVDTLSLTELQIVMGHIHTLIAQRGKNRKDG